MNARIPKGILMREKMECYGNLNGNIVTNMEI